MLLQKFGTPFFMVIRWPGCFRTASVRCCATSRRNSDDALLIFFFAEGLAFFSTPFPFSTLFCFFETWPLVAFVAWMASGRFFGGFLLASVGGSTAASGGCAAPTPSLTEVTMEAVVAVLATPVVDVGGGSDAGNVPEF